MRWFPTLLGPLVFLRVPLFVTTTITIIIVVIMLRKLHARPTFGRRNANDFLLYGVLRCFRRKINKQNEKRKKKKTKQNKEKH